MNLNRIISFNLSVSHTHDRIPIGVIPQHIPHTPDLQSSTIPISVSAQRSHNLRIEKPCIHTGCLCQVDARFHLFTCGLSSRLSIPRQSICRHDQIISQYSILHPATPVSTKAKTAATFIRTLDKSCSGVLLLVIVSAVRQQVHPSYDFLHPIFLTATQRTIVIIISGNVLPTMISTFISSL